MNGNADILIKKGRGESIFAKLAETAKLGSLTCMLIGSGEKEELGKARE